ncbi:MAG: biotin/lipoyl-binding protein [Candidatus Latescibacteria bacterium]|nr:biotin/lipoyl-binding protein [bacterium]MBD3424347.1 biotin/lipoyl-binding protein [Candidatus Latescibacterota bacterium]
MKRAVIYTVLIAVIIFLIGFNVITVRRVSRRPGPVEPPVLNEYPARIYGVVEPSGKEIEVSPMEPGVVDEIHIREGDTVKAGELLCSLESSVRLARLEAARSRVAVGRKAAELSRDRYLRNRELLEDGSISESQYTELKLEKELDQRRLDLYGRELELARAELENLEVPSPADGIVYLCDIREGEYFSSEGDPGIILGPVDLQIRCDIEVIWIGRLAQDRTYRVLNAETAEPVGTAVYRGSSRYLRSKRFSTEDPAKRLSARYQEVIMDFVPERKGIPIRLPVMVELPPASGE